MRDYGYLEARVSRIIRPQLPPAGKTFEVWVTGDSARWQRKYFTQIRRYQSLECRDGMMMTDSDECWRNAVAFSFLDFDHFDQKTDEFRPRLIGAAMFEVEPEETVLEFCWLHPFWRGQRLLKAAWPLFAERFGEFYVSFPRSHAMRGFLKSVGYAEPGGPRRSEAEEDRR
jgi:hypothetical protein